MEYEEKRKQLGVLIVLYLAGYIDLRFGDETCFSLTPNIPYGWIRKGEQRGIPSRKGGNLNVFGLLNLQGELTSYQTTKSVNSETIIEWLDHYAKSIKKSTFIILDNAPWHISKIIELKLKEWEELGLFIFYLPPYSPHLNIIETLWRKIKCEWLKPEAFESKENLHFAVNNILENYKSEQFDIQFSINQSYTDIFG